jgi:hypothetical protein
MWSAAAGVAGLAVGLSIPRGAADVNSAAPLAGPPASPTAEAPARFTIDDVRRVVREELDARERAPTRREGSPPATASPDPGQTAAAARSSAALDAAMSRRTWTDADADAVREDFNAMSAEQRAEWLRQYAVAVNQGRLVPDGERGPL